MTMRTDLAIAALGTGDVDYIAHGGAALRAAAQGFPLKLVFALDHKTPFWLVARPQIKNVRQLTGKKIGVSFPGDTPQIILKRFLRRQGIDPDRDVVLRRRAILAHGFAESVRRRPRCRGAGAAFQRDGRARRDSPMLTFLGQSVPDATLVQRHRHHRAKDQISDRTK